MNLFYRVFILAAFLSNTYLTGAQQEWPQKEWTLASPQSQGMSADSLKLFDEMIASGKYGYVDGMVITRNGKLVYQKTYAHDYEKIYGANARKKDGLNQLAFGSPYNYYNSWWHPYYRKGELHTLQSVTKTITSVIIGVAVTRKDFPDLSTPILHFFDTTQVKNIDDRKRRLAIRHLLTMTGGFEWDEYKPYSDPQNDCIAMEASFDWIQYVINKPMSDEPGQYFKYNSGGSQLLSYIFLKSTGRDIEEYAAQYLFAPLNISNYFWKRTPTGLPDTEGGLYLKATDLARIFYLFLMDGNWNGKELISKEWVRASVSPAINVGGTTKYGYKWWLHEYNHDPLKYAWSGNGFGGQYPVVIPEYQVVAVFTGWNISNRASLHVEEAIRRLLNAVTVK